jgi:hypothetical protein
LPRASIRKLDAGWNQCSTDGLIEDEKWNQYNYGARCRFTAHARRAGRALRKKRDESFGARRKADRLPNTGHTPVSIQRFIRHIMNNLPKNRLHDTGNGFTTKH